MPTKKFDQLRKEITDNPVRARRLSDAEAEVAENYERYQARLAELRRARQLTQTQLSKMLGISQPEVSRIEHQSDVYLSTLRSYIAATGGELDLVARYGPRTVSVILDDLFDVEPSLPSGTFDRWEGAKHADIPLSLALRAIEGPDRPTALRSIAGLLRDRHQIHLACVIYALAAEMSVETEGRQGAAQALGTTGGLARKHHVPALAEALWRRSLEFDPTNVRSRSALGQQLHHAGKYSEAIDHLRMVASVDNRSSLFLGWSLLLIGIDANDESAVGEGATRVVNAMRTWSFNAPRAERGPWIRQLRRLAALGERFAGEVEQLIAFANANNRWDDVTMAVLATAGEEGVDSARDEFADRSADEMDLDNATP